MHDFCFFYVYMYSINTQNVFLNAGHLNISLFYKCTDLDYLEENSIKKSPWVTPNFTSNTTITVLRGFHYTSGTILSF